MGRGLRFIGNFSAAVMLLGAMLLGGATASHAQVSLGIRIGAPPPPLACFVFGL